MPYQALYRKYRSQTFEDVVGQKAITKTLQNAIIQNKISHAYLFNGPRGTGKTSCAKIFAKAINCPNQKNGEPCNECEICKGITAGTLNDVIEIDAASNNGVDEIREIREKVKYAPTIAKYKVYIIDEVHMLSKGAFNALLKTLEEPPKNVVFILATTEPHKIPATIISRTQRFDFKRIPEALIVDHLAMILESLNINYEDDALRLVAQIAEGGMRDALSILDQVIAFSDTQTITLNETLMVTGSLTPKMMSEYLKACVNHNTANALEILRSILAQGKEVSRFIDDMLGYVRDLLLYQEANILPANKQIAEDFKELSTLVSNELLTQIIALLFKTQEAMKLSIHQVIYLEVMTVELSKVKAKDEQSTVSNEDTIFKLEQKIQILEEKVNELSKGQQPGKISNEISNNETKEFVINQDKVEYILMNAERKYLLEVIEAWPEVMNILNEYQRALVQPSHTKPVAASSNGIVFSSKVDVFARRIVNDKNIIIKLKQALYQILNRDIDIVFILEKDWADIRTEFLERRKQKVQQEDLAQVEVNKKQEDTQIVDEAKKLFGDKVEIVED